MEQAASPIEEHKAFVGTDERGRIRVNFDLIRLSNDVPDPRDPDEDPAKDDLVGWAAMLQREGVRVRGGGRGGSNGGKAIVIPFIARDVRPWDYRDVELHLRFGTRLTIGEYEFYQRRPGEALVALREEVVRIVADGTITLAPARKAGEKREKPPRTLDCQVRGLEEREIAVLRASRSGTAALAAYARAKDGERIRWREAR